MAAAQGTESGAGFVREESVVKYLVIVGVFALAGCSSPWVRCERHLTPINGARTTAATATTADGERQTIEPEDRGERDSKTATPPKASASVGGLR